MQDASSRIRVLLLPFGTGTHKICLNNNVPEVLAFIRLIVESTFSVIQNFLNFSTQHGINLLTLYRKRQKNSYALRRMSAYCLKALFI